MGSGGGRGGRRGEEGGGSGGIYITDLNIYTEKRTRRKKMERNSPDWDGGGGAEAFGVGAKKAQVPRAWRMSGNDHHFRVMGAHNLMQMV